MVQVRGDAVQLGLAFAYSEVVRIHDLSAVGQGAVGNVEADYVDPGASQQTHLVHQPQVTKTFQCGSIVVGDKCSEWK